VARYGTAYAAAVAVVAVVASAAAVSSSLDFLWHAAVSYPAGTTVYQSVQHTQCL
jgi:hypothetical protein